MTMEASLVNLVVDSDVVGNRIYSSIPINPTYPLMVYSIVDLDTLSTRTSGNDETMLKTEHSKIDTYFGYLMKLEILGKDRSQVRATKDSILPYIDGFNGQSNGDDLAIFVDSYRIEPYNNEANQASGVFDLTVYHKGA